MKKLILLTFTILLVLAGCTSQPKSSEPFTINGDQISFNNENLTFTLGTNFEVTETGINFGPTQTVAQPYEGQEDTFQVLNLNLVAPRQVTEITSEIQENAENVSVLSLLNGTPYVQWSQNGMCINTFYEIVGTTNNILITDNSCGGKGYPEAVKSFLDSVE